MKPVTKKQKKMLTRILIGSIWFVLLQFFPLTDLSSLSMHLPPFSYLVMMYCGKRHKIFKTARFLMKTF